MIQVDEDDVIVGKRIFIVGYNPDGSVRQIDSTDIIYESFETAYDDVYNPMKILYGGITDDTISDEYKGIIKFKRIDHNENNIAHGMTLDIYKNDIRNVQYNILPIIINKLQIISYRGMFIQPFDIGKFTVCRKDHRELTVKNSLDLALTFIDTYLFINPEWQ